MNNYLFGYTKDKLSIEEQNEITESVKWEMDEIFYGKKILTMARWVNHNSCTFD